MASYFHLTLDTAAPSGVALEINHGALYATSTAVNLDIAVADEQTEGYQMKLWGVSGVEGEDAASWERFSTSKQVTLPQGDGRKTIYLKVRDDVGNESVAVSASITLNTAVPVVNLTGPDRSKISKTAGFTGVRCGYTVVPKEVTAATLDGERIALNPLWNRRQCTKFNGTSYITQRGAEAVYSPDGQKQVKETIAYYQNNAKVMLEGLQKAGFQVFGGVNAPYLWVKAPDNMTSWKFFDRLLYETNVVTTPGVGFGPSGEGYVRLTAFGSHEDCMEAMERIRKWA